MGAATTIPMSADKAMLVIDIITLVGVVVVVLFVLFVVAIHIYESIEGKRP